MTMWGDITVSPRTIFVQTEQVPHFNQLILPCLSNSSRFVLITGDHDGTMPQQVDLRYPHYLEREAWDNWLKDDRIVHLFIEHLDEVTENPKITPIPLGVNPMDIPGRNPDSWIQRIWWPRSEPEQWFLRQHVLDVDRFHGGPQFALRHKVRRLCLKQLHDICVLKQHIKEPIFLREIQSYSFMFCPHGGGIDPNPKAWTALLAGVIPIIQRFPGDAIYRGLPVVIVENFDSNSVDGNRLKTWKDQLAPHYVNLTKRKLVIEQLMSEHWWLKVQMVLKDPRQPVQLFTEQIAVNA